MFEYNGQMGRNWFNGVPHWNGQRKALGFKPVYGRPTSHLTTSRMHLFSDDEIDGVNQWLTISMNHSSARTEFIYNIDEIKQNAAIR